MRKLKTNCGAEHSIALLIGMVIFSGCARAQEPSALVVEGGTLIDGNGGAPVRDSVVVIQGNKIVRVGLKGQGSYPANARVINASGKYVLPGLIEGQSSYNWFFGEAMLNHGVTSTIDVGTAGGIAVPHRDSVLLGKVLGPRSYTGIAMIASHNSNRWAVWTGFESPLSPDRVPKSAEETRELVRLRIAAGADYINFQDGSLPLDFYRAGIDEARKGGKPVFMRAFGPTITPKDAAMLGARNIPHSGGVGAAVTKKVPAQYKLGEGGPAAEELDFYAEMDDAKAKELIQVLVEHKTRLTPTFQVDFPGLPERLGALRGGGPGDVHRSKPARLLSGGFDHGRPCWFCQSRPGSGSGTENGGLSERVAVQQDVLRRRRTAGSGREHQFEQNTRPQHAP